MTERPSVHPRVHYPKSKLFAKKFDVCPLIHSRNRRICTATFVKYMYERIYTEASFHSAYFLSQFSSRVIYLGYIKANVCYNGGRRLEFGFVYSYPWDWSCTFSTLSSVKANWTAHLSLSSLLRLSF